MSGLARSTTTATVLGALALARVLLAMVAIGGFSVAYFGDEESNRLLILAVVFAVVPLVHGVRTLRLVRRRPDDAHEATAALVVMDSILAVSVLGAIDTSSTPLSWLALMFPVVETAVLFSLVPAAVVWFGVSLAFLAVQLLVKADSSSDAFALAFQQLMAVFLLSGPASLLSDSSQRRVQQLDQAKQDADEIWRTNDTMGNILVSFIKDFSDHDRGLTYIVVTVEDTPSNSHALLFSFPTKDSALADRYRHGESLHADEVVQESSH